jgi:hypothetical protein
VPRRYRRFSFAAELGEHRFDLCVGSEPALFRITQTAVDSGQLLGRRFVDDVLKAGIDIERDLGELILRLRRPGFSTRPSTSERSLDFMKKI